MRPETIAPDYFDAEPGDYFALLKPRVMSLVIFTAFCGMIMAPGSIHPFLGFVIILCIAVGAGAAGALNMWYDRDIDSIMERTQARPLPQMKMAPDQALSFGVILSVGSVLLIDIAGGHLLASLLAVTIGFYIFVYTMWLKRSTSQNIVIGGAAGAFPPVIGWAAVTGDTPPEAWLLFLIIFFWTPPHFWALSLYRHDDYKRAGIPMLPVTSGIKATKLQILIYTILLVAISLVPCFIGMASSLYGGIALGLGIIFLSLSWRVWQDPGHKLAMRLFAFSILYLFALFLALTLDRLL